MRNRINKISTTGNQLIGFFEEHLTAQLSDVEIVPDYLKGVDFIEKTGRSNGVDPPGPAITDQFANIIIR